MSIRFKFRSSVAFESVDLDGRRSISVRELRDKIIAQKKLQNCQDFDLLFSDAETGAAFEDEELQIKEGSSVVIKRVPSGLSAPCDFPRNVGNVERKDGGHVERVATLPSKTIDKENFDDFGVDLFPILEGSLPETDTDFRILKFTDNEKDNVTPRCSETSVSRCQNVENSDASEAMSKEVIGDNCCKESDTEEIQKQLKLEAKKEVPQKLDEYNHVPLPTMLDMDLPTELRCSLCNTIFKDAVMIPCCQHSFCEKCIRSALVERGRCPKCSSIKCTVEALLPNLSLRQAIVHFLEAQSANNALENKIPQYVPDVESGIHVKEVSCAMSIRKKESACLHSPSATGRGSNQVITEAPYKSKLTGGMGKSTPLPFKNKLTKGAENSSAEALNPIAGFHGGSSSKLCQNFLEEEVNIATQKNKGLGVTVIDGSGTLMPSSRYKKGDRNCYMCGSPNHLIRDCPEASNAHPFSQTGDAAFAGGMQMYGQAYWHGNTLSQVTPYGNMYGAQGMMHFDSTMAPISPFGISPDMPSMYTGMPSPCGIMRMGGGQPPMTPGAERPLTRQVFGEPQDGKQKNKSLYRHSERERDFDHMPEDQYYKGSQKISHEAQLDKEIGGSFADDESPRIRRKHLENIHCGASHRQPPIHSDKEFPSDERKHERASHQSISGRDQRARHSGKSNSEVQDVSESSNRHSRERKKHHHGIRFKKESEKSGQFARDISRKHWSRKEISEDEKVVANHKKHNYRHHNHLDSGLEPNFSNGRRQHHKEREASHTSRSSRQMPKSKDGRLECERWEMIEGLDDEYRGVNYHKRRRTR